MSDSFPPEWEPVLRLPSAQVGLLPEFREYLARCDEPNAELFAGHVDESDYSVADWIEAILLFDQWLSSRDTGARPFRAMLGYIHCCTLMGAPQIRLRSLKVSVSEALTEFGFEAISDSQG